MEEIPTALQTPQTTVNLSLQQLKHIYNLDDIAAWQYSDDILIAAALSVWKAFAYGHFRPRAERHYRKDATGEELPDFIEFVFVCRNDPDNCSVRRKRMYTGRDGTNNLRKAIRRCDTRRNVPDSLALEVPEYISYSHLMFRVLLVVWCVVNHRPFHTVADPLFLDIIHMLRPDAIVPTPHTLSSDLSYIYGLATTRIRDTFMQMDTGAHLAIDGWSSPLTSSFLGVIVFWRSGSTMWHAVLDFIHLTQSHTGVYLAEKTLHCLDRFGLRHHIVSVCLDNASNNDTLVRQLSLSLPNFRGARFRGRCMAHITNLIAQAFMSVFNRPSSRKRKLATSSGARALTQQSPLNTSQTLPSNPEQPTLDVLDVALDIPGELVDEGREQHDTVEVQKAVATAIETVYNLYGLCLSDDELRNAREVYPKAAGFANKIHASGTMLATFAEYRHACRNLLTTKKEVPTQLVVTRWGAAAACGKTHEEFRTVVDMMTSKPGLGLTEFDMPTGQWDMLIDANECLEIFDQPTRAHSHTGVPLVHEAIPDLLTMKFRLELMRDGNVINPRTSQPPRLVIRVAACAALNVLNKYLKLLEAADIYWLAIVLCPWYKLQWLEDNNYPASRTQLVRRILEDLYNNYSTRFGPSPGPSLPATSSTTDDLASMPSTQTLSTSFWLQESPSDVRRNLRTANLSPQLSPLPAYLESPPIAKSEIDKLGGLLQYWENEAKVGSILGRMALDILTAPSSSVDAERAFSGGRMAVNYRQHRTSVETFRAKMAVGSWYGTPLLSDAAEVLDMLEGKGNTEPDPLDLD